MKLLKQLRLEQGLTQAELAEKIQRSKYFISHLENGHALPGREALQELARVLGVPMERLLESAEPPPSPQNPAAHG